MCAAKRLSESERKNEIMDSAADVIIRKGLENATMEDIIAGTSLSKGVFITTIKASMRYLKT